MDAIRVVLAEDHAAVRQGFRRLLGSKEDIDLIAEATNGVEAIAAVRTHRPHVLLLDIQMPIMNGLEVIQELKETRLPIRILMVSSFTDRYFISEVLKSGIHGYLVKDNANGHLAEAIRKVASGRKWISGVGKRHN